MSIFDDPEFMDFFNKCIREEEKRNSCIQLKETFSRICDAFLFYSLPGFTDDIPQECRYLENLGCFVPNFYMVAPFYYLGGKPNTSMMVKDGSLFLTVLEDADLDSLDIDLGEHVKEEILESMPIVLFRNFQKNKSISIAGEVCDDKSNDIIRHFRASNGTMKDGLYEFIGVFKAERKEPGNGKVYKMTKLFDRYYFNSEKIFN